MLMAPAATWVLSAEPPLLGSALNPYQVPMASSAIIVDGVLDESAWDDALQLELPYETWPAYNIPAPVRTTVMLTYDLQMFYVAVRAHDPDPSLIQAHLSDHDSISGDDQFGIEMDTFNDERRAYNFFINPLGIQEDSVAIDGSFDFSWDAIWEAKTQLQPWGYSAEIAIPFSSIRFQSVDGPQVWGFNAERALVRDRQYWVGAVAKDRDNACRWCQMLKIEGFEGVSPGNSLELIPALTATDTAVRTDPSSGSMERLGEKVDGALTAHWGMTRNLTLSGTLKPDFSQVEADALQLDVNQPFALFYPEKRPFFSEGSDFFRTPINLVHTRTMREPLWGLKLAGKVKTHTLGVYVVEDQVTNLLLPGSRGSKGISLDGDSLSAVFRYKKEYGSRLAIGALITDRNGGEYFNRVVGLDAAFRASDADTFVAQIMRSSTSYPDEVASRLGQPAGTFLDDLVHLRYYHETQNLGWWGAYDQIGDGFRADLGFVPRVGFRELGAGFHYRWWAPSGRWWSRLELGGDAESSKDDRGNLLRSDAGMWFEYLGTLHSRLFIGSWWGREGYAGQEFEYQDVQISLSMRPVNSLELKISTRLGDQVDYLNARPGYRVRIAPQLVWRATRRLAFDVQGISESMEVDGRRFYDATIAQGAVVHQFSPNSFVRGILQHVDHDYQEGPGVKIVTPEDARSLFLQLLYSYKLNPRSVLFLGYSERSVAGPGNDLIKADRTFFLKIGYSLSL